MIYRALAFSTAVLGGAGASQFPEYSQQYLQRLSGAVDELRIVVEQFDASAEGAGLSREEALDQMTGTEFLNSRQSDMRRTFSRYERLSGDLVALENAGTWGRVAQAYRMVDSEVARAALEDFKPAVPVTAEGAAYAGGGAAAGWFTWAGIWASLAWLGRSLFRRKRQPALATGDDTPPLDASRISLRNQARYGQEDE